MVAKTLDAVYEQGLFRLADAKPLGLTDGQRVRLVVESIDEVGAILDLAASVYTGLSEEDILELDEIIRRKDDFFGESPEL